jgi:hypothetical protein
VTRRKRLNRLKIEKKIDLFRRFPASATQLIAGATDGAARRRF